jgi:hypothetical protein
MAKMTCVRLEDGHVELAVTVPIKTVDPLFAQHLQKMLADIRPLPLEAGCERDADAATIRCVAVLHSHTSDPGIFEAITSFSRIMATIAPIDTIDACGLMRKK